MQKKNLSKNLTAFSFKAVELFSKVTVLVLMAPTMAKVFGQI